MPRTTSRLFALSAMLAFCLALSSCTNDQIKSHGDLLPEFSAQEYRALFMNGEKVGFSASARVADANEVTTVDREEYTLERYGKRQATYTWETCVETPDGKPLAFKYISRHVSTILWLFPVEHVKEITGKRNDSGTFDITITSDGKTRRRTIDWPDGALLSEGYRLLQKEKGLAEGTAYTARLFDTEGLVAEDVEVRVGPIEEVQLLDVRAELARVRKITHGTSGTREFTLFIDSEFNTRKTVTHDGSLERAEIACTPEYALAENEGFDYGDVLGHISSPIALWSIPDSLEYHLVPGGQTKLEIPSTYYQTVTRASDGGLIVTASVVNPPKGAVFPYKGDDRSVLEAMEPTDLFQSDHETIVSLGRKAVGDTTDAAKAARNIESFVSSFMHPGESQEYSAAYPSALEIAVSRKGMCREYAVLTTALCRAVGIPAQIVTGYKYSGSHAGRSNVFVAHAWTQAYIGGKWIPLDSTVVALWGLFKTPSSAYIATAVSNGRRQDPALGTDGLGAFEIKSIKR